MGPRRARTSIVASPVLIGAVTILVTAVAIFLSYNANNGLPFVPMRTLKVDFRSGQELFNHAEVREGGQRIGVVTAIKPVRLPDRTVGAQVTVSLERQAGAFPVDSSAVIRPRSALGEENVELTKGSSTRTIPNDGTLPVDHTRQEVELDQVLSTFDAPTRQALRTTTYENGDALIARGPDLNATLQLLPAAFGYLRPVMHVLASPQTALADFFRQLDTTAATLAPVSQPLAHLFTTMANTWSAVDRDPAALRDTIAKTPSTEAVGTTSFRDQIPLLRDSAQLGRLLTPVTGELRTVLPLLNSAVTTGTRVTGRTPVLYHNLQSAMSALRDLATSPTTNASLRGLTATITSVQPTVRYLGPFITVCNDWTFFFTFAAEAQTGPGVGGQVLRGENGNANHAPNSVGSQGATTPTNGEPDPTHSGVPEYFHGQPYGAAVTNDGRADCEYGQRGYIDTTAIPPSGLATPAFKHVISDPHNPVGYPAGPTYRYFDVHGAHGLGPTHVPAGETFTREPGGLGAQLAPALRNPKVPTPAP